MALDAVACFADDLNARLHAQQHRQSTPEELLVVDDNHAHGLVIGRGASRDHSSISHRKPLRWARMGHAGMVSSDHAGAPGVTRSAHFEGDHSIVIPTAAIDHGGPVALLVDEQVEVVADDSIS